MDPHVSDSSLQKTSPLTDPAAIYHLNSEVSAQATMLTSHQQQLQCLTSITEELVKTLQALQLTTPPPHPPAPESQPMSANISLPTANPRLSFPEKFDGSPDKCKGFLLQCSFYNSHVSFICSLLTGRALTGLLQYEREAACNFPHSPTSFINFERCFEHTAGGKEAGEQLLTLRQGRDTAADYSLTFRTLAAQTVWDNGRLKLLYRKGLSTELQTELACRDEGRTQFIDIAIRLDNLLYS